jgi:uncharacterized membrane protein YbhN (UPF0104 family)
MVRAEPATGRVLGRHLLVTAKVILSAGLIYYAFSKIDLGEAWLQMRNISVLAVIATMILFFIEIIIASVRLRQILATMGPQCRFVHALDIVFIGAFFSQTLISFVGGDAMRIWRIVRSRVSLGIAAKSVVLDRAAGLAGLLVLVLLTLPFLLELVADPVMRFGLMVALVGGFGGFALLMSFSYLPSTVRQLRLFHWIAELGAAAIAMTRSTKDMVFVLGLSLAIHVVNVIIIYVLTLGLSIELAFEHCLLLVPPVMFLSMLPISVAGWGVREGAMIVALGIAGVAPAQSVALSVCFGLGVLAISLPGGVMWLVHRGEYASAPGELRGEATGKHARDSEP